MATFRKIHVTFWSDPFIQAMSPEQKYFYLYLLTNDKTRQCGIYEISKKQIAYDTGYNTDTVSILLKYFIDTDKIRYSEATSEIAIKNWLKYNENVSSKVQVLVNKELAKVKDRSLIQYLYSIDIVSIHNPQGEEEREEEVEDKNTPPEASPEVSNQRNLSAFPKSGTVPTEDEKKSIPQPPSNDPDQVFNAEEFILGSQVHLEQLLTVLKLTDMEWVKGVLRKYHLHNLENSRYPMKRVPVFAGFEKWLRNERKPQKNGTHQQSNQSKSAAAIKADNAATFIGLAQERIAALAAGATGS